MQFGPVSLQNGLKMCVFLRSIMWATGCYEDRLKLVTLTGFFIFEGQATATDSLVVISCVQSGCGWIFDPFKWTLKY